MQCYCIVFFGRIFWRISPNHITRPWHWSFRRLKECPKNPEIWQDTGQYFLFALSLCLFEEKKSNFIMPAHCWTSLFSIQSCCSCYALKSNVHVIYFFYIWIWFINHLVLIFYTFKHFYFKVTVRTRIELWITWSSLTAVRKLKKKRSVCTLLIHHWFYTNHLQYLSYDLFKLAN